MCNARILGLAAIAAVGVATGGFGLLGAEAVAGGAAAAEGAAAAGAAGTTTAATTAGGLSTLQTGSMIASAAGAGLSAYGQYKQAEAAGEAARYNQKVADIQAQDALNRGDLEQQAMGRKVASLRGQQRANMAANGLDLSSGTPEAILEQTDYYGLEDQRTIANNARREAASYQNRGNLYAMQADSSNPWAASGGSLLTGAGQVADKWYRYNNGGRNYASTVG